MKLFVLLSRFPYPLEKGDKLRAYHQLRLLSKKHDIILCAFHEGRSDKDLLEAIKPFCKAIKVIRLGRGHIILNLLRTVFTRMPFQVGYFYSLRAHGIISTMIAQHKPDVIYCQLIRMSEYVRKENTRIKVLDYMDAFSKGIERRIPRVPFFLKPVFRMEHRRLLRYEREVGRDFKVCTVISEQDKQFIHLDGGAALQVIPNGVETSFFSPRNTKPEYDLLFTGNMSYPPNVECAEFLAKKIMPLLAKEMPGVKLLIAGASPAGSVWKLRGEHIDVKGWTNDIRDYYSNAKIFISPIFMGTGMQNKILEAMAMRLPCITSSLVNNPIGASPGKEILVSDSPEEMASIALSLLRDPAAASQIGLKGQEYIKKNFSWESSVTKLSNLFR